MARFFWLALIVAIAALGGGSNASAGAPDFTVTKGDDTLDESCTPDDCSLRDAIFEAEEDPSLTTISLPVGTFVIGSNDPDFGDFEIDTEVVIEGAGRDDSIIDGQQMSSVFSVTAEGKLTLRDLTVTNGKATGGAIPAGGISSLGELTLERVMVSESEGFTAGGVFASDLEMEASSIEGNTGESAGGLVVVNATIRNSFIVANTATGNQPVGGMLSVGTVDIADSGIQSNDATSTATGAQNGGAGGWQSGSPVGTLAAPQGFGGPSVVTALRVEVDNNSFFTAVAPVSAPQGLFFPTATGGWSNFGALTATDLDVSGNAGESNEANGGFTSVFNERITINRATFNSNYTTAAGVGGAAISGPADLTNVTVSNNESDGAVAGLAMTNESAPVSTASGSTTVGSSIVGSTIADNFTAQEIFGAGLFAGEDVTIEGSIVSGNEPMNCINVIGTVIVPTSLGYNIDDRESCNFESTGDMSNTDPMLGALHDAGGDVGNMRNLPEDSPAIDAWLDGCPPPSLDGRQVDRPQGSDCDIGAFEREVQLEPTQRPWGDLNCANFIEHNVDGMLLLLFLADVDATVPEGTSDCPNIGQTISVDGFPNAMTWGDMDCNGQMNGADALRIFLYAADTATTTPNCPDVGAEVTVQ